MNRTNLRGVDRPQAASVVLLVHFAWLVTAGPSPAEEDRPKPQPATPEGRTAAAAEADLFQEIRQAWQKRMKRFENVRILFNEVRVEPQSNGPGEFAFAGTPVGADNRQVTPDAFGLETSTFDIVMSGNKSRMVRWSDVAVTTVDEAPGELVPVRSNKQLSVFNGTTARTLSDQPHLGYPFGTEAPERDFFFSLLNYRPLAMSCRPAEVGAWPLPLDEYRLDIHQAKLDGETVVRLVRVRQKPPEVETVWLDPQREFVVLRLEQVRPREGDVVRHQDRISYRVDPNWGPIPTAWTYRDYSQGVVTHERLGKVSRFEVDPQVQDGDFEITFAPGTVYTKQKKRGERNQGPTQYFLIEDDGTSRPADGADFKRFAARRKAMEKGENPLP